MEQEYYCPSSGARCWEVEYTIFYSTRGIHGVTYISLDDDSFEGTAVLLCLRLPFQGKKELLFQMKLLCFLFLFLLVVVGCLPRGKPSSN